MKCPLCKEILVPFEDPNCVGDWACPTMAYYHTPVVAKFGVNEETCPHYVYDVQDKMSYVEVPPYRMVFCKDKILCCRFKGVVGMQFESICHLPPQRVSRKGVNKLVERLKGLMIFT